MILESFFVLIPDESGELLVCPLDQVLAAVMETEDRQLLLEQISENCVVDSWRPTPEAIANVRAFNETGDAEAYWSRT